MEKNATQSLEDTVQMSNVTTTSVSQSNKKRSATDDTTMSLKNVAPPPKKINTAVADETMEEETGNIHIPDTVAEKTKGDDGGIVENESIEDIPGYLLTEVVTAYWTISMSLLRLSTALLRVSWMVGKKAYGHDFFQFNRPIHGTILDESIPMDQDPQALSTILEEVQALEPPLAAAMSEPVENTTGTHKEGSSEGDEKKKGNGKENDKEETAAPDHDAAESALTLEQPPMAAVTEEPVDNPTVIKEGEPSEGREKEDEK